MIGKFWTRKCRGCEDRTLHTAHLTWFGKLYFRYLAGWTR